MCSESGGDRQALLSRIRSSLFPPDYSGGFAPLSLFSSVATSQLYYSAVHHLLAVFYSEALEQHNTAATCTSKNRIQRARSAYHILRICYSSLFLCCCRNDMQPTCTCIQTGTRQHAVTCIQPLSQDSTLQSGTYHGMCASAHVTHASLRSMLNASEAVFYYSCLCGYLPPRSLLCRQQVHHRCLFACTCSTYVSHLYVCACGKTVGKIDENAEAV